MLTYQCNRTLVHWHLSPPPARPTLPPQKKTEQERNYKMKPKQNKIKTQKEKNKTKPKRK